MLNPHSSPAGNDMAALGIAIHKHPLAMLTISRPLGAMLATVMLALAADGSSALSERGTRWRVVNPTTDPPAPIAGATIIVSYHGIKSVFVESQRFCDRIEMLQSDPDGWFLVPDSRGRTRPSVTAHKSGHAYPGRQFWPASDKREAYLSPIQLVIKGFRR